MSKFKVGDRVIIVKDTCNHTYPVGKEYAVKSLSGIDKCYLKGAENNYLGNGCYIRFDNIKHITPPTRKGKAKHLKEEVLPVKEVEVKALQKEIRDIKADIKRLTKYDSVEAEVAHLLSQCIRSGGDEVAITKVLKQTNLLGKAENI